MIKTIKRSVMPDQKLENLLNLSLEATPEERSRSSILEIGYNPTEQTWDLIVQYTGDITRIAGENVQVVPLLTEYAIVTLPERLIEELSNIPEVEFIEKPKRLFFSLIQGKAMSCVNILQNRNSPLGVSLYGSGVLVACVDSGVDYAHPDFINEDGTTRILSIWDQTIPGNPPEGYLIGTEYTSEQINEALQQPTLEERYAIVPSRDVSGHGTGVLGIAAGNGRALGGTNTGVAPQSDILVVKLGVAREEGFPRTTELMQGIDYVIRKGISLRQPVALNLSFGNNYGSHDGRSLLARYVDGVANLGRTTICVGTGNEGSTGIHTSGTIESRSSMDVQLAVGSYETGINIQIYKQFSDEIEIALVNPSGQVMGPIPEILGPQRFTTGITKLLTYYGEPSPSSTSQEIFVDFIPSDVYIESGIWNIRLVARNIVNGQFDMWLPGGGTTNQDTRFYQPRAETTLTIPSTAERVISVGAYNSRYQSFAEFSGRGYTRLLNQVKPDLVAPGVDIQTAAVGGGYGVFTGTSFATPFVTGSAALMMEWGIINGNDPYLYGEKVKAYLRKGARKAMGETYPNNRLGFGSLCLRNSFPV
jgi:minor extracellular serine protease Vpr